MLRPASAHGVSGCEKPQDLSPSTSLRQLPPIPATPSPPACCRRRRRRRPPHSASRTQRRHVRCRLSRPPAWLPSLLLMTRGPRPPRDCWRSRRRRRSVQRPPGHPLGPLACRHPHSRTHLLLALLHLGRLHHLLPQRYCRVRSHQRFPLPLPSHQCHPLQHPPSPRLGLRSLLQASLPLPHLSPSPTEVWVGTGCRRRRRLVVDQAQGSQAAQAASSPLRPLARPSTQG